MIYPTQHHGTFEKGNEAPGYDHSKEAVFKACGKTFKYAKTSLYVFDELNPIRVACVKTCLLYTSPSPRDGLLSRMPSSA